VSIDSPSRLKIHQVKPAAKTLARAFHDDPVFVYFFPEVSSREDKSTRFFQMLISYSIHYGEAYCTTNLGGVAAWLPSDKLDMSVWGMIRSGVLPLLLALGRNSIKRMLHFDKYSVAAHKRNASFPHLVLQPLGVDPLVQGKGYASLLLRTKFERLDGEGKFCYVDTQTEKNVSMYKHYGFKVVEEFQIPDTAFNNWVMLREPRTTH
jgi:ribosomal protein S18 acetylase RimI-like enzyme